MFAEKGSEGHRWLSRGGTGAGGDRGGSGSGETQEDTSSKISVSKAGGRRAGVETLEDIAAGADAIKNRIATVRTGKGVGEWECWGPWEDTGAEIGVGETGRRGTGIQAAQMFAPSADAIENRVVAASRCGLRALVEGAGVSRESETPFVAIFVCRRTFSRKCEGVLAAAPGVEQAWRRGTARAELGTKAVNDVVENRWHRHLNWREVVLSA